MKKINLSVHYDIPDSTSPDGARPSMWGISKGGGEKYNIICKNCGSTMNVEFPRYDKILNRYNDIEHVLGGKVRCPSCQKGEFDLYEKV